MPRYDTLDLNWMRVGWGFGFLSLNIGFGRQKWLAPNGVGFDPVFIDGPSRWMLEYSVERFLDLGKARSIGGCDDAMIPLNTRLEGGPS